MRCNFTPSESVRKKFPKCCDPFARNNVFRVHVKNKRSRIRGIHGIQYIYIYFLLQSTDVSFVIRVTCIFLFRYVLQRIVSKCIRISFTSLNQRYRYAYRLRIGTSYYERILKIHPCTYMKCTFICKTAYNIQYYLCNIIISRWTICAFICSSGSW